jgi:hypothetical protein
MRPVLRICVRLSLLVATHFEEHAQTTPGQAKVITTTESRMRFFKATKSGLNRSRRQVCGFAAPPSMTIPDAGIKNTSGGGLIKDQISKRSFGTEREKVVYYDIRHRKVLTERYENHQLVQLALAEYTDILSVPFSQWLLVRGGYLRHNTQRMQAQAPRKSFFYFNAAPTAE